MNTSMKDLINNISIEDNVKSGGIFNTTMNSKIIDAIETRKVELGNSVYNKENNDENI